MPTIRRRFNDSAKTQSFRSVAGFQRHAECGVGSKILVPPHGYRGPLAGRVMGGRCRAGEHTVRHHGEGGARLVVTIGDLAWLGVSVTG